MTSLIQTLRRYPQVAHPGILLRAYAGARTPTVALDAIQDEACSQVPAFGCTITYAVATPCSSCGLGSFTGMNGEHLKMGMVFSISKRKKSKRKTK